MHNERKYQHQKIPYQIPKLGLQLAVNTWKREQKRAAIRNETLPEPDNMLIEEMTLESGTTQPNDSMELEMDEMELY
jgi:hypothetical protein